MRKKEGRKRKKKVDLGKDESLKGFYIYTLKITTLDSVKPPLSFDVCFVMVYFVQFELC